MKILIALHQCMDLGGIINHTEQLIGGLQDLGHTAHLKEFVYADNARDQRKDGEFTLGPSGIPHHQGKGWNFRARDRVPYKTWAGLRSAIQIIQGYDMVVWTVPVPSKNKQNVGNDRWPYLYQDHNVPQIAFIHDGNAPTGYPHVQRIDDLVKGFACVHHAALGSTAGWLGSPRALILNPQHNPVRNYPDYETKLPGFINMQTFKAWKHAHELIGAIRFMKPKSVIERREVVGKGIEYQYLTSEDKCKDAYFHDDGERYWEAALENGMVHHDYWDVDRVSLELEKTRVLVDPSWSKKYSKFGGHYNRVAVDGAIRGCVVVAHADGMGNDLFRAGEHYIDLKPARDVQDYAEIVQAASQMDDHTASRYRSNNRNLLKLFDRTHVATQVIDLAMGAFEQDAEHIEELPEKLDKKIDDIMFNHFGVI